MQWGRSLVVDGGVWPNRCLAGASWAAGEDVVCEAPQPHPRVTESGASRTHGCRAYWFRKRRGGDFRPSQGLTGFAAKIVDAHPLNTIWDALNSANPDAVAGCADATFVVGEPWIAGRGPPTSADSHTRCVVTATFSWPQRRDRFVRRRRPYTSQ